MKHIKKRWLSLAIAPALLALMSVSQPAYAADYSGDCAGVPASISGNATITDSGACTISHPVTATGYITILASSTITTDALTAGTYLELNAGGDVTTGALTATAGNLYVHSDAKIELASVTTSSWGFIWLDADSDIKTRSLTTSAASGYVHVNSTNGKIEADDITAPAATIWLEADKEIATGTLKTSAGDQTGAIQIDANKGGDSSLFTIGGSGHTNGINGTVDTTSSLGGGTQDNFIHGGLRVTNGTDGSTGGITVNSMSDIAVVSSASRSGIIILNAQNGTLTLPTGSLSSDGSGGGAGVIELRANTLVTGSGTVITANQSNAAVGTYHGVTIAANTLTLAGSGAELHADGNGVSTISRGFINLVPRNALILTANNAAPNAPFWSTIIDWSKTPITVTGAANFTATANGNNSVVHISGFPVTFSNGAVTLESKGATDHQVEIIYPEEFAGTDGLVFSGNGSVSIDVSGVNGKGGIADILVDKMTVSATVPSFTINADAASTGNYDGGHVSLISSELNIDESVSSSISADGKGTGFASIDGVKVFIGTGQVYFDSLSARGGTDSADYPTINVFGSTDSKLTVTNSIDTSVLGTAATAGTIRLEVDNIVFDGTNPSVKANSGSVSGAGGRITFFAAQNIAVLAENTRISANGKDKGGVITIETAGDFGIANGTGTISLEAKGLGADADGPSDGGEIKIVAGGSLDLYGGAVSVEAGPTGGNGGKLDFQGTQINVDGDLGAVGSITDGDGGSIKLNSTSGQLTLATGSTISAIGQSAGAGGQIVLTGNTLDLGTGTIDASSGNLGTIDTDEIPASIVINSSSSASTTFAEGLIIKAIGGFDETETESGNIEVTTAGSAIINSLIDTSNSSEVGLAGNIVIIAEGGLTINGTLTASTSNESGIAGIVDLTYRDSSAGAAPIVIGSSGSVRADQSLDGAIFGGIYITNSAETAVGVFLNGLLSTQNGRVIISTLEPQSLQITGEGQMTGALNAANVLNVNLDMANGSITVDVITAIGTVDIATGNGDILSLEEGKVTATSLTLISGGNIGAAGFLGLGPRFQTAVQELTVTANIAETAYVGITNTNESGDDLILHDSTATGTFAVNTNNSLTIRSVSSTNQGGIYLQGDGSLITIAAGKTIKAFEGVVSIGSINGSTKLVFGTGAKVISLGTTGNHSYLSILLGSLGTDVVYNGLDPNLVLTGSEAPRISLNGFTANPSPSEVRINSASVGMLLYGQDTDSITFSGSNELVAED